MQPREAQSRFTKPMMPVLPTNRRRHGSPRRRTAALGDHARGGRAALAQGVQGPRRGAVLLGDLGRRHAGGARRGGQVDPRLGRGRRGRLRQGGHGLPRPHDRGILRGGRHPAAPALGRVRASGRLRVQRGPRGVRRDGGPSQVRGRVADAGPVLQVRGLRRPLERRREPRGRAARVARAGRDRRGSGRRRRPTTRFSSSSTATASIAATSPPTGPRSRTPRGRCWAPSTRPSASRRTPRACSWARSR